MIVIKKKRLIWISTLLCCSLCVVMLRNSFDSPKVVETVNLPVSNKVIVLDAGHGVPDERSRK